MYPGSAVQSGEGEGKASKPSFLDPMVHIRSSPPIILGGKGNEESVNKTSINWKRKITGQLIEEDHLNTHKTYKCSTTHIIG